MDFDFTQEQVMLRNLAREFFAGESAPKVVRTLMEDSQGFSEATWQQMSEMGLPGLAIDPAYGGQGLGMIEQALVLEEMGRAAYPGPYFATCVLAATAIAASGQSNQIARYLPDIAQGRTKATLALLENALSWKPSGVQLRAERRGGEYVLSGTKRFVPFAHVADLILIAARTGDGEDGTTAFAVARQTAGLRLVHNLEMDHTSKTSTLVLDEVHVDADAIIGEVGRGWAVLGPTLQR